MTMQENAPSGVPMYRMEQEKELRAHSLSKIQSRWLGTWLLLGLALIVQWWVLPLKLLAVPCFIMGLSAFIKSENGVWFTNLHENWKSRRLRAGKKGEIAVMAKRPPFQLRIVGFPTDVVNDEVAKELAATFETEELQEMVKADVGSSFTLGTIYSRAENSDTGFVVGGGTRSITTSATGSYIGRNKIVAALDKVALESDTLPSVALIYSTRPVDMLPYTDWYHSSIDPAITAATPMKLQNLGIDPTDNVPYFDIDTFLKGGFDEQRATVANMAQAQAAVTHQEGSMIIGLTVERPASWPNSRDGLLNNKLSPKQLADAPVTNLTLLLEQELINAGVSDVAALSEDDLDRFVRSKWDVKTIRDWIARRQEWVTHQALQLFEPESLAGVDPSEAPSRPSPWPDHKIVVGQHNGKDYLYMDGTYHRVLQVRRFGKREVFADDFAPLFESRDFQVPYLTGLTVSVCGDMVDIKKERDMLTRRIVFQRGIERGRKGEREMDEDDIEKAGKLQDKRFRLHQSGSIFAFSYNVYVTISAATPSLLDSIEKRVRTHARQCHVKLRYIQSESRQLRAFVTANFGVNMANR